MTMSIIEYLKGTANLKEDKNLIRNSIFCNDGFSISVQASERSYCTPRKNLFNGEYTELELGCPSEEDSLISKYAENSEDLTGIFPYVPIEIVEQLIIKHKGIPNSNSF